MKTKDRVLEMLINNPGRFISGQEMADMLFVTRAAVWKAVKALEKDGVEIEAVQNAGYRLKSHESSFDLQYLKRTVWPGLQDNKKNVFYYEEIDSTNDEALRLSRTHRGDILVIADSQSSGRGRRGRSFYSPKGTGLYMSYLFYPGMEISRMTQVTAIAALAAARGIDEGAYEGRELTWIKWVNDIFIDDKKVAGILTEAFSSMENVEENKVVIGIGINIYKPDGGFPKDIQKSAGALYHSINERKNIKEKITAGIINEFVKLFDEWKDGQNPADAYRNKSMLIGNYVRINTFAAMKEEDRYAKVLGITDDYHLLVRYDDGREAELSSGEVSVVKY